MTHMGIHALIIEDQPKEDGFWVLHLSLNGAKWEKADDLVGVGCLRNCTQSCSRNMAIRLRLR